MTTTITTTTINTDINMDFDSQEDATTFEGAVQKLGEILTDLYSDSDEAEQEVVQQIVDEAQKASIRSFGLVYQQLVDQVIAQEEKIGMLQHQIQAKAAAQAAAYDVDKPKLSDVKVPSLDELIKMHKGKGVKLNGYHVFCMCVRKVFGHFPEEGVWKGLSADEQKPWKTVAAQYTTYRASKDVAVPVLNPFAQAQPAMTPQILQAMLSMAQVQPQVQSQIQPQIQPAAGAKESKANSAYRLWLNDWHNLPENKGKSVAPAGTWKNVPAAVKEHYETKFKALQASRAQRA
jgi:hypothetical protein